METSAPQLSLDAIPNGALRAIFFLGSIHNRPVTPTFESTAEIDPEISPATSGDLIGPETLRNSAEQLRCDEQTILAGIVARPMVASGASSGHFSGHRLVTSSSTKPVFATHAIPSPSLRARAS